MTNEFQAQMTTALITILGFALKYHRNVTKAAKSACGFFSDFACLPSRVKRIDHELQLNSGHSVKDMLTVLGHRVDDVESLTTSLGYNQGLMLEEMGFAVFEANGRGEYTRISPGLCRLVGTGESELLGNEWIHKVCPDDREEVLRQWNLAAQYGRTFDFEFCIITAHGERVKTRCRARPRRDAMGHVVGYDGTLQHITAIM